ncbi:MAG: TRAM domain-containing protein [Candidatus Bathyarchaeota archaeon]|nr:TRAM domain-containing protein [Candidatus Bathyarchaeota archaeon]
MEDDSSRRQEGGFLGPRRFPPKPVKVGEEYEVDITETSQRGEGIARIEGLVVFVAQAKVGDHVRLRITRISRKFAEAELVEKQKNEKEETSSL